MTSTGRQGTTAVFPVFRALAPRTRWWSSRRVWARAAARWFRALYLARDSALPDLQSTQRVFQRLRCVEDFPVRAGQGGFDAKIHAHHSVGQALSAICFIGHVYGNGDEPVIRRTRYSRGQDLAGEPQRLRHVHPTQHGDTHAVAVQRQLVVGDVEAVSASTLALERRSFTPAPAFKRFPPAGKRLRQVGEGLRVSVPVDLVHPRELLVFQFIELPLDGCGGRLRTRRILDMRLILPIPFGKSPVVDETSRARRLSEVQLLIRRRVQANPMTQRRHRASRPSAWPCNAATRRTGKRNSERSQAGPESSPDPVTTVAD